VTDLTVSLRLLLQSREFTRGLLGSERGVTDFSTRSRRAIGQLDQTIKSVRNNLAALGVGFAAVQVVRESARLDKSLTQIRQTAGATGDQVRSLRADIFQLARDTGRPIDTLLGGFNNLIQAGLDFKAALASTRAIAPASAVTGAGEDVLAGGLAVAAASFQFDLTQPRTAVELLDQMVVAGRLGNAELEDLASIFSRVGVNAKAANLQFPQTLGFIEGLSQVERQPERLATLADSTLRLFTNDNYRASASKATGVPFYNKDGSSRDPLAVLDDIAARYQKLATDQARDRFIARAFGTTDLDTQRGIRTLLGGDSLKQVREFTGTITRAGGTVKRDLGEALDNADSQAKRLAANFKTIGDAFAQPINRTLSDLIQFQLDPAEKGGLGLSPGGAALATGGLVLATGAAGKLASDLLKRIPFIGGAAADAAGTAAGIAQGQLIKQAGLATPVFVTNFPASDSGGAAGSVAGVAAAAGAGGLLARLGLTSAAAVGTAALGTAGVLAAGAAGFELGTKAYNGGALGAPAIAGTEFADKVGRAVAIALAAFGNQDARNALASRAKEPTDVTGTIKIELDNRGARVASARSRGVDFDFSSGPLALSPP